ncbi:prostasin-like [Lissotriton helveticus]
MSRLKVMGLGLALFASALILPSVWGLKWEVSIQNKRVHECGGVLVADKWILSSASCFKSLSNVSEWSAVFRRWQLPVNPLEIGIQKVIKHSSYTMQLSGYDIALLKLVKPVNIANNNVNITTIALSSTNDRLADGTPCDVVGWGNVHKSGVQQFPASQVKVTPVSLLNHDTCNQIFQTRYLPNIVFIQSDMLCSNSSTIPGACKGDTGGPLVCIIGGSIKLVGILSWNMGCSTDGLGVYTNVSAFSQWIQDTETNNNN